jgi:DNA replication protein DnaC
MKARQAWDAVKREAGRQYAGATFDSFRCYGTDAEQQDQRAFVDDLKLHCSTFPQSIDNGGNVVLLGPCGTGKDHLMIGMVREAIRSGCHDVGWVDAAEMFGTLKDALAAGQIVGDYLREWIKPQLLVISDLIPGGDALTPFETDILFRLLNARGRRLKATWVNANVQSREEASQKMSAKCLSRLGFRAFVARTTWSDFRKVG